MCWEKKTHLSKGLCGSEPYIAPELFDQKGSSHHQEFKSEPSPSPSPKPKFHHNSNSSFSLKFKSNLREIIVQDQAFSSGTSSLDPQSPHPSPFPSSSPAPPGSPAHQRAIARNKNQNNSNIKSSKLIPQPEYDARQVDVWAAAVVFYCMQFQELPWRVAKNSDPTYNTYRSQYGFGTQESASATPAPLNNLVPRECRNVIKHMLDPDPKTRWSIDEALQDKWMKSITVCKEGEVNDHAHTTAGLEIVKV